MTQETAPPMPQPTAEHEQLKAHCGVWNVECTFYMGPDAPPMTTKGTETVEMFGQFWTTSLFETDMFGAPFQGKATLGYDPSVKQWVSTWVDTMTPSLYAFRGNFDEAGKVLEMHAEGYDCMSQQQTKYRTTEEHKDDGSRVFEMFMNMPDGTEMKLFTHVYTKA